MMTKAEVRNRYPGLHDGMRVYSRDGEKLGSIMSLDEDSFTVEKGFFFPKDFTARYSDVAAVDVTDDAVVLDRAKNDLEPWRQVGYGGWVEFDRLNADSRLGANAPGAIEADRDELRMPVTEEQLDVDQVERLAEEMRPRRVVHSEMDTELGSLRQQRVFPDIREPFESQR